MTTGKRISITIRSPLALQPSNDFESALDRVLSPGSYTVILKDAQGQPGVGLFELYDLGGEGSVLENIQRGEWLELEMT